MSTKCLRLLPSQWVDLEPEGLDWLHAKASCAWELPAAMEGCTGCLPDGAHKPLGAAANHLVAPEQQQRRLRPPQQPVDALTAAGDDAPEHLQVLACNFGPVSLRPNLSDTFPTRCTGILISLCRHMQQVHPLGDITQSSWP